MNLKVESIQTILQPFKKSEHIKAILGGIDARVIDERQHDVSHTSKAALTEEPFHLAQTRVPFRLGRAHQWESHEIISAQRLHFDAVFFGKQTHFLKTRCIPNGI